MTLIIGARGKHHVALIADGLSVETNDAGSKVKATNLQKLFPIQGQSCVVTHFGQNELGPVPVSEIINGDRFQRTMTGSWKRGLNYCAAKLIDHLDDSVSQTLKGSSHRKDFGIWLTGLWPCTDIPEIVEVYWKRMSAKRVRANIHTLGDLSIAGDGVRYVKQFLTKPLDKNFSVRKIFDESPAYSMEFVKRLYAEAEKRQAEKAATIFGGDAWMALITADGVDLGKL
ncbi:MAG: hypothetical protein VX988_12285 [Planctomycetota bacterium]|nr:hypothetical protein [Planctomycetota bacterium]